MCIRTIHLPKRGLDVPCGKCYECVKRRRNDWYIRCLYEYNTRPYSYFGLLTYAEVGTRLEKRDIQLFLKRLRIKGYTLSYLIAGELGEKKDRPHWHCLFFANQPIAYLDIAASWKGGYEHSTNNVSGWVRFEKIRSSRSIRYTVKYVYKYVNQESRFVLMMSRNPAIGSKFVENNQRYFLERKSATFTMNGKHTAMPRYYKRKIFDDYPDIKQHVNDLLAAKVADIKSKELQFNRSLYPNLSDEEIEEVVNYNKFLYNEHR